MPSAIKIVGVLNVTPDSFYDGGKFCTVDTALQQVSELLQQGADFIEIGGESTGPGSKDISEDEEHSRVIPILKKVLEVHSKAKISVDTSKAIIAREALETGAVMINDVTAGRGDAEMFRVLAASDARLVLMFAKDESCRTTIAEVHYDDVVQTIMDFLKARKQEAIKRGIKENQIILDPGLGHFVSSDPRYSFQILRELDRFSELGCPLLLSPSRKSFLAGEENLPVSKRLSGTIAASVIGMLHGATYIRTHDVLAVRRGCAIGSSVLP